MFASYSKTDPQLYPAVHRGGGKYKKNTQHTDAHAHTHTHPPSHHHPPHTHITQHSHSLSPSQTHTHTLHTPSLSSPPLHPQHTHYATLTLSLSLTHTPTHPQTQSHIPHTHLRQGKEELTEGGASLRVMLPALLHDGVVLLWAQVRLLKSLALGLIHCLQYLRQSHNTDWFQRQNQQADQWFQRQNQQADQF